MPTKHKRINVSFKLKSVPLPPVAQEMVEEALELQEDIYLSRLAEEAEKRAQGKPPVPANKLWKN